MYISIMSEEFSRTELLIGSQALAKLKASKVAVFGVGGVGGYIVEALARSGVGNIDIVDNDKIALSNINRQIIASHKTVGMYKVDVARERILDINPDAVVNTFKLFYTSQNAEEFDFEGYDYIADAIDTVSGKLSLIEQAKKYNVPVICSMGAGNKMDPTKFEVADISQTSVCPLARAVRTELKKKGIYEGVKVVYSKEKPVKTPVLIDENSNKQVPGSNAFVPSVAGLIMAGEIIKDLIRG